MIRLLAKRAGLMRDCARRGHRFIEDEDGYHCASCPLRVNGDGKPPPYPDGDGERNVA